MHLKGLLPHNKSCEECGKLKHVLRRRLPGFAKELPPDSQLKLMQIKHIIRKMHKCRGCGALYCCRKCQKAAWNRKMHKLACRRALKIA